MIAYEIDDNTRGSAVQELLSCPAEVWSDLMDVCGTVDNTIDGTGGGGLDGTGAAVPPGGGVVGPNGRVRGGPGGVVGSAARD
eukprot:1192340-Prorocentrum_minimum.AAC.3